MNLGDQIRQGTKWLATGQIGTQFIQLAVSIVLARLLTPADFGLIVTIQIFTGLAGFISGGGMGQALIQAKITTERDYQAVFTLQLAIGALIYLLFFLIAPYFSQWFDNPLYEQLLKISAISFLLRPFINNPSIRLRRAMRFRTVAITGFLVLIITSIATIILATLGWGVWSLVLGGLIGAISNIIALYIIIPWRPVMHLDRTIIHKVGSYGIKTTAADFAWYCNTQVYNLIISRMLGPAATGLFNKANSLRMLPATAVNGSTYQTVFRALSQEQDNLDKSHYIYHKTITLLAIYTFPVYIGLYFLSEPFLTVVYGSQWTNAATALEILALAGFFSCLASPSGAVLAAQARLGTEVIIHIITLLISATGCYLMLPYGIDGIAWIVVIAACFTTLSITYYASQTLNISLSSTYQSILPALILSMPLATTLALFEHITQGRILDSQAVYLFCSIGIGGITYVCCFMLFPIAKLKAEQQRWAAAFKK